MEEILVIIKTYGKYKTFLAIINQAKQIYYHNFGEKLSNPKIGQKSFSAAFNRIVNTKKQTNIQPIMENDVYKANIFNEYFATQSTINDNGTLLPAYIPKTNKSISHFLITEKQIIDIISKLNANKSHRHYHISVAMLQLCPTQVAIPLYIIFQKCISSGTFNPTFVSMLIFNLFIEKETVKWKTIIDLFRSCPFMGKS